MSSRTLIESWIAAALKAVDPEELTRVGLAGQEGPATVLAIGKAAPAMCRGAAAALGEIAGLCITNHVSDVPQGVELLIGDHPIPGERSAEAARRAMALAPVADLALISGGGSALCELPIDGVDQEFVVRVNRAMLEAGASIEEMNLVRRHLSAIKGGGLAALPTYILSDVGAADPAVVASGPTIPTPKEVTRALATMRRFGLEPTTTMIEAMSARDTIPSLDQVVHVVGDGQTAAKGLVTAALSDGVSAMASAAWLTGTLESALEGFLARAGKGVTVAVGETTLRVKGRGSGGRNTHAALVAAQVIEGSGRSFAALATDGVDGNSGAAGAIVDGQTLARGGNPDPALASFDSASYLGATDDLLVTGPTGTNVADLWLVWDPD